MPKPSPKKSIKSPAAKAAKKKPETAQPAVALKSAAPAMTPKPAPAPVAVPPTPTPLTPPAPKTAKTVFTVKAHAAKQVQVCGDFNGWQPEAAPMTQRADGTWETSLTLRPGRYQYKFVVDGNWIHDPNAKMNVPNAHLSLNSVIDVQG
jgi:hypothetical protein